MDCCHGSEEYHSSSQDLATILSNLPHQQYADMSSYQPQTQESVKMKVTLDLPGYEAYLPTYLPGQRITGKVQIQVDSLIKVSHFRVALYGNVQVYGDRPGHSINNGLFDYQRNEQLINSGLRIIKQATDNINQQRLVCKRDKSQGNNQHSKPQKTTQDRHIEKLIRQIASIDHTMGLSHGVINDVSGPINNTDEQENDAFAFELTASNLYQVHFSIRVPTSRRLSGTFDHPHYPVSYRIVAMMKFKDNNNSKETLCYSTAKVCLEPFIKVERFQSRFKASPTYQFVQNKDTIWNTLFTQFLNCGLMTMYMNLQKKYISSNSVEAHLELPTQVFERSQFIPLTLKLTNHAFASDNNNHFKISVVKINVELIRRINMTCSMNEQVESQTIQSTVLVFKSSQEQGQHLFFTHGHLSFDLSNHIQIPSDSVCTIFSASTRDVFSLTYDVNVSLDITGTTSSSTLSDSNGASTNQEKYYVANRQHHIWQGDDDTLHQNLPIEPYPSKFKTYRLSLDPLTVVVVSHLGSEQ